MALGNLAHSAPAGTVTIKFSVLGSVSGSSGSVAVDAKGNYVSPALPSNKSYELDFAYSGATAYGIRPVQENLGSLDISGVDELMVSPGSFVGKVGIGSSSSLAGAGEVEVFLSLDPAVVPTTGGVLTDSTGSYTLSNVQQYVNYYLYFKYLGSGPYHSGWFGVGAGGSEAANSLNGYTGPSAIPMEIIEGFASITGHAYLGSSSTPAGAGDVTVTVKLWGGTGAILPGISATTDATGAFTVTGLPDDAYTLVYSYNRGGAYKQLDSLAEVVIYYTYTPVVSGVLLAQATLSGHVNLGDATHTSGVGDVLVSVYDEQAWGQPLFSTTTTDASGNWTVTLLAGVPYRITLTYRGAGSYFNGVVPSPVGSSCTSSNCISITSSTSTAPVVLAVANSISGTVTDANGVALSGVTVTALAFQPKTGNSLGATTTTSAADGSYSLRGLLDGDYEVDFSHPGYATQAFDHVSEYYLPDYVNLANGTSAKSIDAGLYPDAVVTGSVTLPADAATATDVAAGDVNVEVEVFDSVSNAWVSSGPKDYPVTGSNGSYTYRIADLAPDAYKFLLVYSSAKLYGQYLTDHPVSVAAASVTTINLSVAPVGVIPSDSLVKTATSPTVYFVDGGDNFIPIASFDVVAAMGLPTTYSVVPDNEIVPDATNGNTISPTPLSSIVDCYGDDYIASAGKLWPVSSTQVGTLPVTSLADDTCDAIPKSAIPAPDPLFITESGSSNMWLLNADGYKDILHVGMFGGPAIGSGQNKFLTVASSYLESLPNGLVAFPPGTLIKSTASPQLYVVNSNFDVIPVPTMDLVAAYNFSTNYVSVTPAQFASFYTAESAPLTSILDCGGGDYITSAGGVVSLDPRLVGTLPTTRASSLLCLYVPGSAGQVISGALFVKTAASPTIWYVDPQGTVHAMASFAQMAALSARSPPRFATVAPSFLASLPVGADAVYPGELVKSASSPTVYLVDGSATLFPITSFATASDMGLSTSYSVVSDATIIGASGIPLTNLVSCAGAQYVAGSGRLWPLPSSAAGSLPITAFSASLCGVVTRNTSTLDPALIRSAVTGTIYTLAGATKTALTPSTLTLLLAGRPLVYVNVNDAYLASVPNS